jgi:hypothetical protein|tara:strand:+ start:591 stop:860 length:270 start_codon:yes stop_codon:yes gene_type:complete
MKKVINQIRQIDNISDLNLVIDALKDQQKLLRSSLARKARSVFSVGDKVKVTSRAGIEFGVIEKVKVKKAIVSINGRRFDVPLTIMEAA